MKKSILGLSLLVLALVAAACGGGSLEGEEVLVLVPQQQTDLTVKLSKKSSMTLLKKLEL